MSTRRLFMAALATPALAQAPRPTTMVVPFPAGGTTDLLGRMMAEHWRADLGLNMVVENRPGAGTTLGAQFVARAAPDGHTLLMATSTTLAVNPTLMPNAGYNPLTDFAPIALVAAVPLVLIVNPALPIRTVSELVAHARTERLFYASAGNGTPHHLAGELFKRATGLDITHVPYRGSVPAMTDLIAGRMPMMFMDGPPALPMIRDGRMRALAVTSRTRLAATPEIPTMIEAGIAEFEAAAWQGVVAPAGTPTELIARLAASAAGMLARPETGARLTQMGLVPLPAASPAEFGAYMRAELQRWGALIRAASITADP
jgi:tripartite-type tricarboxylate transporter receptor subunit TctC